VIVSENADGRAPWTWGKTGLGHILLVAQVLGRPPQDITDRRLELGYPEQQLPDAGGFEEEDMLLLSENLDARGPWLHWRCTPSWKHVRRAERATGRSPQESGERLTSLGHDPHVPPRLERHSDDSGRLPR
jgi:hypothetical protein